MPNFGDPKQYTRTLMEPEEAVRRFGRTLTFSAQVIAEATRTIKAPTPPATGAQGPSPAGPRAARPEVTPRGLSPALLAGLANPPRPATTPVPSGTPVPVGTAQGQVAALALNTAALNRLTAAIRKAGGESDDSGGKKGGKDDKEEEGKLSKLGNAMELAFGRGRSAILSLVASADLTTFPTFQNSIQGLSIEVGKVFVPYVETASRSIQGLTTWFKSLDASTKAMIGYFGVGAVATGGLVTSWRTLSALSPGLAGNITKVAVALRAFALNPVGLAITATAALAGGVLYLTGALDKLGITGGKAANAMQDIGRGRLDLQGVGERKERPKSNLDLIGSLPVEDRQALYAPGMTPEKSRGTLADLQAKNEQRLAELRQKQIPAEVVFQRNADVQNSVVASVFKTHYLPVFEEQVRIWKELPVEKRVNNLGDPIVPEPAKLQAATRKTIEAAIEEAAKQGVGLKAEDVQWQLPFERFKDRTGNPYVFPRIPSIQQVRPVNPKAEDNTAEIRKLELRADTYKELSRRTFGQEAAKSDDFLRTVKLPINSRFSDTMSFTESVQTQAFNVGKQEAENLQEQLKGTMEALKKEHGGLLGEINSQLEAIAEAIRGIVLTY